MPPYNPRASETSTKLSNSQVKGGEGVKDLKDE
jgi:hypothetical protein